jgi:phospholipase/carboxylesterase
VHPAVVLLHGRGADEDDLAGVAPFLDGRLLIVSARAPYPFPGSGGYTWYDLDGIGNADPEMFRVSYEALSAFVDDIVGHYPVDRSQVFLFGFSMGTMMSFALALTRPELIRGVVANSGYIPDRSGLRFRLNELSGTAFFVAHGEYDPVIPVGMGRKTRDLLQEANAELTYREYLMGHEISQESLSDAAAWLSEHLNKG